MRNTSILKPQQQRPFGKPRCTAYVRIIEKCTVERQGVRVPTGFKLLSLEPTSGFCEDSNAISGSVQMGKLLDWPSNYQLPRTTLKHGDTCATISYSSTPRYYLTPLTNSGYSI
jgi:hypothetical protein